MLINPTINGCRECDGKSHVYISPSDPDGIYVICEGCGSYTPSYHDAAMAVAHWNANFAVTGNKVGSFGKQLYDGFMNNSIPFEDQPTSTQGMFEKNAQIFRQPLLDRIAELEAENGMLKAISESTQLCVDNNRIGHACWYWKHAQSPAEPGGWFPAILRMWSHASDGDGDEPVAVIEDLLTGRCRSVDVGRIQFSEYKPDGKP